MYSGDPGTGLRGLGFECTKCTPQRALSVHLAEIAHSACSEHALNFDEDSGKRRNEGVRACHKHLTST